MKKMLMVFLGVMFTVSLVGCGSSEEKAGKSVADVTYEFLLEKADKKNEEPWYISDESNVTVYEDEGAYFVLLEKNAKGKSGEFTVDHLYKVRKHKDGDYSVGDVSDTNPYDVDLNSLTIIYETKKVKLK